MSDWETHRHQRRSMTPSPRLRKGLRIRKACFVIFGVGVLISLLQTMVALATSSSTRRQTAIDVTTSEEIAIVQHQHHMQEMMPSTNDRTKPTKNIPVFYNLYVDNLKLVKEIVQEQFSSLKAYHHPIFVNSIGREFPIANTTLLHHHAEATEMVTLRSLWQYCHNHTDQEVVYLHSKGSFHPSPQNDQFRRLITLGALSDHCANLPPGCNVCSSRFSPFPHPHAPGNAWLARCSYVQKLIDPAEFENDMEVVRRTTVGGVGGIHESCFGTKRFANEHWIHSHPSSRPCDLYTNKKFTWGYRNLIGASVGERQEDFKLHLGPRYDKKHWREGCIYTNLRHRMKEYKLLYDVIPDDDWWGWKFFLEEV